MLTDMNWRHTHVWEINRQLVVADTVEEAISIYRMYSEKGILSEPVTIQQIGNSDAIGKDYSAIMGYEAIPYSVPYSVGESGTYVKDYERNPKPVPTDNKPIDVFDIKPAPSSADVNWNSTNDTQSTSKLDWMHRDTKTFYGG